MEDELAAEPGTIICCCCCWIASPEAAKRPALSMRSVATAAEPVARRRHRVETLAQIAHGALDETFGDFAIEEPHALVVFLLPGGHVLQRLGKLLLERLDHTLDALALRFRQRIELFGLQHLALMFVAAMNRREREARRRAQQSDALLLGAAAQALEGPFLTLAIILVDGLAAVLIFLAFEDAGDGDLQILDEAGHAVFQRRAGARRKLQHDGFIGRREAHHIGPVGGRAFADGDVGEKARHRLVLARAVRTEDEEIVALAADRGAEAERVEHTLLPRKAGQVFKLRRRLEFKRAEVAGAIEKLRR